MTEPNQPAPNGPRGYDGVDEHPMVEQLLQGMRETARLPAVGQLRGMTRPAFEVREGGAVLDVGCGLADVLIEVAYARRDIRCVGIDTSAAMLAAARADADAAGVTLELHQGSATALPFPDASFGAARSERVLQWLPDPVAGLAEMVRVVEPGGFVVAIDTDWRTIAFDLPDEEVERAAAHAFASRPSAAAGGHLRGWMLELGLTDVTQAATCASITHWDPDASLAPPGFIPPFIVAELMTERGAGAQAEAFVAAMTDAARRDRLHISFSMFAAIGRVPQA